MDLLFISREITKDAFGEAPAGSCFGTVAPLWRSQRSPKSVALVAPPGLPLVWEGAGAGILVATAMYRRGQYTCMQSRSRSQRNQTQPKYKN